MKALALFALLAVCEFSIFIEAADNAAALQVALNTCYKKTKCTEEIMAEAVLMSGETEILPDTCDTKCYMICVLKLARLADEKTGIDKEKLIGFLHKTIKDDEKLRNDIIHFLNLCFDPAKDTANRLMEKCKSDPKTSDPKTDCDDKWGCFHSWGVMWCAIENYGVMIMAEHSDKA